MGKYRSRLEIIRDILLAVSCRKSAKKTRIMFGANLGYKVLTRYLEGLLKTGLLEYDGASDYWLTDKGERFLSVYKDYDMSRRELEEQTDSLENEKKALTEILSS